MSVTPCSQTPPSNYCKHHTTRVNLKQTSAGIEWQMGIWVGGWKNRKIAIRWFNYNLQIDIMDKL